MTESTLSTCHADAVAATFANKGWAALAHRGIGAVGSRFATRTRKLPRAPARGRLFFFDRAFRLRLSPLALEPTERPPPAAP